jgi:2-polyprenyl-3-methyl-5-hydroxy-6-metoxy-1,4-benzoquinol methylase
VTEQLRNLWACQPDWYGKRLADRGVERLAYIRKQVRSRWKRRKIRSERARQSRSIPPPPPVEPVWPLPRSPQGPSEEEIRSRFAAPALWHYDYQFEGGLSFRARHAGPTPYLTPGAFLRRTRHLLPWLMQAAGGSLEGKRILDLGCNSGIWAIQCALLGAREVVGVDIRSEMIAQADFIKSIVGADNAQFCALDFWDVTPENLGGQFDAVLNIGLLYHLPDPLEALRRTQRMSSGQVLLDTAVHRSRDAIIRLHWEEAADIHLAGGPGVAAWSSKAAIELMLDHLGFASHLAIPTHFPETPREFKAGRRASWLLTV